MINIYSKSRNRCIHVSLGRWQKPPQNQRFPILKIKNEKIKPIFPLKSTKNLSRF